MRDYSNITGRMLLLVWVSLAVGCGLPGQQQQAQQQQGIDTTPLSGASSSPGPTTTAETVPPLPFTGRLVEGDRDDLPPAIAGALTTDSPVTFAYREQMTHNDYHIPLIVSAFDPVTYVGAPLGDFGVTAFAELTIKDGDRVLGDYTAKAFVSRSYTLYSSPTHQQVEEEAKNAVRAKIDDQLARDLQHLGQELNQEAAPR